MLTKIIIATLYLAICSLCASTWVDRVAEDLKSTAGKMAFVIVFLLCPFVWLYQMIKLMFTTVKNKLGDKNAGD